MPGSSRRGVAIDRQRRDRLRLATARRLLSGGSTSAGTTSAPIGFRGDHRRPQAGRTGGERQPQPTGRVHHLLLRAGPGSIPRRSGRLAAGPRAATIRPARRSWLTSTMPAPMRSAARASSRRPGSAASSSSSLVGSSASSRPGRWASAAQIATRCASPPDSVGIGPGGPAPPGRARRARRLPPPGPRPAAETADPQLQGDVVQHVPFRQQRAAGVLVGDADVASAPAAPGRGRQLGQLGAGDRDRAGLHRLLPGEHPQQGGLAGPVRSLQQQPLAGPDGSVAPRSAITVRAAPVNATKTSVSTAARPSPGADPNAGGGARAVVGRGHRRSCSGIRGQWLAQRQQRRRALPPRRRRPARTAPRRRSSPNRRPVATAAWWRAGRADRDQPHRNDGEQPAADHAERDAGHRDQQGAAQQDPAQRDRRQPVELPGDQLIGLLGTVGQDGHGQRDGGQQHRDERGQHQQVGGAGGDRVGPQRGLDVGAEDDAGGVRGRPGQRRPDRRPDRRPARRSTPG